MAKKMVDIFHELGCPKFTKPVLVKVALERCKQDGKWGVQDHDPFKWLAILGEEVGEVNKAVLEAHFSDGLWRDYTEELIQVAAVAVAMVECVERLDEKRRKVNVVDG